MGSTDNGGRRNPKGRRYAFRRASVACSQCRKAKTRCNYLDNGECCFRCANLGLKCSLGTGHPVQPKSVVQLISNSPTNNNSVSASQFDEDTKQKINEIHSAIMTLLKKSERKSVSSQLPRLPIVPDIAPVMSPVLSPPINPYISMYDSESNPTEQPGASVNSNPQLDTLFFNMTPFRDIRAVSSFFGMPFSKELAYDLKLDIHSDRQQHKYDIISLGLINYDVALELIRLFTQYYGRWTSFPQSKQPKDLLSSIRQDSSLLLAICCLMGLMHYHGKKIKTKSKNLYLDILKQIEALVSLTVCHVPQSKQLLQSLVMLSSFSLSLSFKDVYFDGWYLSGYTLLHFITREMDLNLLSDRFKSHPDRINNFRLWNHLTLTHLTFCVFSGRPCLVDTLRMDQCREILEISSATSFDGRIVAELSIMLSLYNCLQFKEPVDVSLKELNSAYKDWKYLCEQKPLGEFIKINFHFSKMMIYRRNFLQHSGKEKGLIYHSPLMFNGEVPSQGKEEMDVSDTPSGEEENEVSANSITGKPYSRKELLAQERVRNIVNSMIDECIEVSNLAAAADRFELSRSTDLVKFEIFFSTIVMINVLRMGFGTSPRASKERDIMHAIDQTKQVCSWLDSDNNYYNNFVRSYFVLISKFSDSIHEQEL